MSSEVEQPLNRSCSVCKRPVILFSFRDMEPYEGCSEFCMVVSPKLQQEFLNAKDGEWVLFPCEECGGPVEGEWCSNDAERRVGSCCSKHRRLRLRTELLHRVLSSDMNEQLRADIEKELKRG